MTNLVKTNQSITCTNAKQYLKLTPNFFTIDQKINIKGNMVYNGSKYPSRLYVNY